MQGGRKEGRGGRGVVSTWFVHLAVVFFFLSFFILRRMGRNKALAHHTSTYFHTP